MSLACFCISSSSSNNPTNMFPGLPSQHPMPGGIMGNGGTSEGLTSGSLPPFPLSHLHQGMKQDKYDKPYYGGSNEFKNSSPGNPPTETTRGNIGGTGSSSPPPVTSNPENNTCRLMDYRNQAVAAFTVDGRDLICLPQAFELFLKHLVGGLHTVYTKLKRLDVVPVVCNVEQVRVLRSLGAIQPGVNRCKLISPKEFDILYEDCTNSSARPGRPPKRTGGVPVTPDTIKKQRLQATSDYYHHTTSNLMDPKKPQFNHPYLSFPEHAQKSIMSSAGGFPYPPHLTPLNFLPFGHPGLLNLMASHLAANRGSGLDVGTSRYGELRPFNVNGRKEDDQEKPEADGRSKFERHHHGNVRLEEDSSNDAKNQSGKQQMHHHHLPLFHSFTSNHHQGLPISRHPHFQGSGFETSASDRPLNLEMNKRLQSPSERRSATIHKDSDIQSVASSEDYNDVTTNNNMAAGFLNEQKPGDQPKEGSCRNGNESDDDDDDHDDANKVDDVSNVISGSDDENINVFSRNGKSLAGQQSGKHLELNSPEMVTMEMLVVNIQAMLKMAADKMREKERQFVEERDRLRRKLRKEKKLRRALEMQLGTTPTSSGKARGIPHHVIQPSPMALPLLRLEDADKTPTRTKDSKCTSAMSSPHCDVISNENDDNEADQSEQIEVGVPEVTSKSPLVKSNTPLPHRFSISMMGNGNCINGSP